MSSTETASPPGMRLGAMILAVGGLVWWVAGSIPTPGALVWFAILGLFAAGPLLWYGRRLPDDGEAARFAEHRRPYGIVFLVQLVLFALIAIVCGVSGIPWLIPGLVAIVNGAHLLPLGRWVGQPAYARLGVAVIAIGVLGLIVGAAARAVPNAMTLVGLLVAISYWVLPTIRLLQQRRAERGPSTTFRFIEDDGDVSTSLDERDDDISTSLDDRDDDSTPLDDPDDDDSTPLDDPDDDISTSLDDRDDDDSTPLDERNDQLDKENR